MTPDDLAEHPVPTTWSGHRAYASRALVRPDSLESLRALVRTGQRLRALGSRHSFNDLVDSPGLLVDLRELATEPDLYVTDGGAAGVVTVSGAMRYGALAAWLHERGWALPAMASLPHISVAGAVATGTHGSGDEAGSLATAVVGLELLGADGEVHALRMGEADFPGAVVSLGALGLVLRLDLAVEPRYDVATTVLEDVPFAGVLGEVETVWASATSVSAFTRWDGTCALWRKQRTDRIVPDATLGVVTALGGRPADTPRHPLPDGDPQACTPQLGEAGPWHERLPHFRQEVTPSAGAELQSEYLLPRERAAEAIEAAAGVMARHRETILISEIRSVASDDLWLSGSYGRATIGLHTTWRQDVAAVREASLEIEAALAPFEARPHWGKLFERADLAALYPRWEDARALLARYDPAGQFTSPLLERVGLR
ncbi:D-arabinono-1,4-lactone oxidase [Serinibacter salmoneus]|uniref:Xylitol oxidase n=1 Tax=Serinibacter salmoneus TaxID=556530 RepID=A0A2A9D351_9MICO|nr:D-arabinono-1,4-lactone oxidase [Serinibacter salmoneus]PFG20280.1 xylitol oxidase [Serinibacter salmoneus]